MSSAKPAAAFQTVSTLFARLGRLSAVAAGGVIVAFAIAATGTPASAAAPEGATDYKTHLEFAGYEVEVTEKRITAKHDRKYNFALFKLRGGVLMQAFITGSPKSKEDPPACLAMMNTVNQRVSAARTYFDKEGDLAIELYYQPPYDKTRFANMLDMMDEVRTILIEEDKALDCLQ